MRKLAWTQSVNLLVFDWCNTRSSFVAVFYLHDEDQYYSKRKRGSAGDVGGGVGVEGG